MLSSFQTSMSPSFPFPLRCSSNSKFPVFQLISKLDWPINLSGNISVLRRWPRKQLLPIFGSILGAIEPQSCLRHQFLFSSCTRYTQSSDVVNKFPSNSSFFGVILNPRLMSFRLYINLQFDSSRFNRSNKDKVCLCF